MKRYFLPLILVAISTSPMPAQDGGAPVKVTTTIHSDGTQSVLRTDPDAHIAESTTVDANKQILQRTVYAMDDQGQYTSATIFDSKGKLILKSVYHRDANNRVSEQLDSTPEDKPIRKLVFEYEGSGKLARVRTFDPAGNETTPANKTQSSAAKRHPGSKQR